MAAFIAKQMLGNQMNAVKDIGGGEGPTPEEKEKMEQLERERLDALREAEERRVEKHRKMEEEREGMRQGIRDKYGIKKREEKEAELKKQQQEKMGLGPGGGADSGLNRKKKTPEEIAAEQAEANQDDFTMPSGFSRSPRSILWARSPAGKARHHHHHHHHHHLQFGLNVVSLLPPPPSTPSTPVNVAPPGYSCFPGCRLLSFACSRTTNSLTLELEQWNRRSSTPVANHNFSGPIGPPSGTLGRSGGPSPSCSPGHSSNIASSNVNNVAHPMLCGPPPLPQNGPPMTMGPYNPGPSPMPHVMHHPPHPMQHPGPPPPPNHMQPPPPHGRHTPFYEMRQPEFRIYEMNKRLWQRTEESDNLWWDAFASEFFEDDATLTVTFYLEDGPKRYTIGRTLIPRYFRSIFEGGVTELQINLKHIKESYHNTTITLDCDQSSIITYHGKPSYKMGPYPHPPNDPMKEQMMKENSVFVCTEGRLILEFAFDDLMRIKSWHFSTRHHQELISRSLVAMQQAQQDPGMLEQLSKNITRQGLTNSTLNYLRLCVILEPMQELMSRYKTYPLSPRDCLKTTLFQKWQRMVAPPETSRPPSKRRKRKSSTNAGTTTASKKKNNQNNMSPVPPPFTLATQDVMVVGEPSLMGGEFGDEDERLITRLENNQYDPNAVTGTNGLEDADDFNSLGSSTSGGGNNANNSGNNSAGIMGPGANGGPPSWSQNGAGGNSNNSNVNGANSNGGAPPPPGGSNGGGPMSGPTGGSNGPNGPNSQEESKKQSPPNMSQ